MRCFGEFLVARELIDADSLHEALMQQEQTIVPLGLLAVQSSYLTREQVRLTHLLVQRVDYDGEQETVSMSFHPTGIRTLSNQLAEATP